jgi:hypothetical protein
MDRAIEGFPEGITLSGNVPTYFITVSDWASFQAASIAMMQGDVKEVVWAADPSGVAHRIILDISTVYGIRFWGRLDQAAIGLTDWPPPLSRELGKSCWQEIYDLVRTLPRLRATMHTSGEGLNEENRQPLETN